jgi:signal peptidase
MSVTVPDAARGRHAKRSTGAWRRVASVAAGVFLVAALALTAALTVVPALAGGRTLTVLSGSMEPAIGTGSVVVIRPVAPEELQASDVISFTTQEPGGPVAVVTHRIAEVRKGQDGPEFVTRGDANDTNDPETVRAVNVQGEVWYHVPWFGHLRDVLFSRTGLMFGAAAVLLVIGLWLLPTGRSRSRDDDA